MNHSDKFAMLKFKLQIKPKHHGPIYDDFYFNFNVLSIDCSSALSDSLV